MALAPSEVVAQFAERERDHSACPVSRDAEDKCSGPPGNTWHASDSAVSRGRQVRASIAGGGVSR